MSQTKIIVALLLLTILFIFNGCSDQLIEPPVVEKININGKVVDLFLLPVPGKYIKINDEEVITDGNGKFYFQEVKSPYDLAYIDSSISKYFFIQES